MVAGRLGRQEDHPPDYSGRRDDALVLEIVRPGEEDVVFLPMRLQSMSAQGVTLEGLPGQMGELPAEPAGHPVTIHLPADRDGGLTHIPATLLWTRVRHQGSQGRLLAGLELEEPSLRVRQALEAYLPQYPRDLKGLWDHWDRSQEEQAPAPPVVIAATPPVLTEPSRHAPRMESALPAETAAEPSSHSLDFPIYLVALGSAAVGLLLFTFGPESLQAYGAILAIYGSLAMGARSVWTMWQRAGARAR
ncbi:MAG: PilZ domain-containing protein [Deltaproteobacteria bacterium]|nr:PilZ domain-containing protein [Deltaproteobacteria bacterium]